MKTPKQTIGKRVRTNWGHEPLGHHSEAFQNALRAVLPPGNYTHEYMQTLYKAELIKKYPHLKAAFEDAARESAEYRAQQEKVKERKNRMLKDAELL